MVVAFWLAHKLSSNTHLSLVKLKAQQNDCCSFFMRLIMYLKILSLLSMCLVLSACSLLSKNETTYTEKQLLGTIYQPQVAREFRAAWVATVANINWPTEPGLAVTSSSLYSPLHSTHFSLQLFHSPVFNSFLFSNLFLTLTILLTI